VVFTRLWFGCCCSPGHKLVFSVVLFFFVLLWGPDGLARALLISIVFMFFVFIFFTRCPPWRLSLCGTSARGPDLSSASFRIGLFFAEPSSVLARGPPQLVRTMRPILQDGRPLFFFSTDLAMMAVRTFHGLTARRCRITPPPPRACSSAPPCFRPLLHTRGLRSPAFFDVGLLERSMVCSRKFKNMAIFWRPACLTCPSPLTC